MLCNFVLWTLLEFTEKNAKEKNFPLYATFMYSRDTSCLKSCNSSHFQEHFAQQNNTVAKSMDFWYSALLHEITGVLMVLNNTAPNSKALTPAPQQN